MTLSSRILSLHFFCVFPFLAVFHFMLLVALSSHILSFYIFLPFVLLFFLMYVIVFDSITCYCRFDFLSDFFLTFLAVFFFSFFFSAPPLALFINLSCRFPSFSSLFFLLLLSACFCFLLQPFITLSCHAFLFPLVFTFYRLPLFTSPSCSLPFFDCSSLLLPVTLSWRVFFFSPSLTVFHPVYYLRYVLGVARLSRVNKNRFPGLTPGGWVHQDNATPGTF